MSLRATASWAEDWRTRRVDAGRLCRSWRAAIGTQRPSMAVCGAGARSFSGQAGAWRSFVVWVRRRRVFADACRAIAMPHAKMATSQTPAAVILGDFISTSPVSVTSPCRFVLSSWLSRSRGPHRREMGPPGAFQAAYPCLSRARPWVRRWTFLIRGVRKKAGEFRCRAMWSRRSICGKENAVFLRPGRAASAVSIGR